jgi:hypothetical protein
MKTIKEGSTNPWWAGYQASCELCLGQFELDPMDKVEELEVRWYPGLVAGVRVIKGCPTTNCPGTLQFKEERL